MHERYAEKNFRELVMKLVKLENECDEKNEIHPYLTRKKVSLIDSWNLYCEQIAIAEEFLKDWEDYEKDN